MNKQALQKAVQFIDSWLQFNYEQQEIPGFCVAISHKGEVIFNRAYGYADVEAKTKLTPQHIFRIASHSKSFTATAVMQLREKGKLQLDDYVISYLPWLKEHKDKRWQHVTLRQLLSHGAGLFRDGDDADFWQLDRPFPDVERFKREVLAANLVLDNNVKMKYSNYGFGLLGMVVEVASGRPYNEYVIQNIVKPLGLKNTGPEYTAAIGSQLVTGYTGREVDKKRLPIVPVDTGALSAATGFYSTAEDVCKYFSAHFAGSKKLLNDESKKEMQRVHFHANRGKGHEDYALGLILQELDKRQVFGHGGGFPGHITKTMADPKDELVVTALTNCLGGPATDIVKGIYSILDYFQDNMPTTKPRHDMSNLEGRYMNLWFMANIVVTGNKVVAAYPGTWYPLSLPDELERIDNTTFKTVESDSFSSEGQLVKFKVKDGKVASIDYTGMTLLPQAEWEAKQRSRNIVQ